MFEVVSGPPSVVTAAGRRALLSPADAHTLALAEATAVVPVTAEVTLPAWAGLEPGPDLAAALAAADPAVLDEAGLVELCAGYERLAAWTTARQAHAISVFAARRPTRELPEGTPVPAGASRSRYADRGLPGYGEVSEFLADELAARLALSHAGALARVTDALAWTQHAPLVLAALAEGLIEPRKASAFTPLRGLLDAPTLAVLVDRVLPEAPRLTLAQLKTRIRAETLRLDPDGAAERAQRVHQARRVELHPGEDTETTLRIVGPADDTLAVYSCLDLLARHGVDPGDPRSMDQRRFDALTWAVTTHPVITGTCICQTDPTPGHTHCTGNHAPAGNGSGGSSDAGSVNLAGHGVGSGTGDGNGDTTVGGAADASRKPGRDGASFFRPAPDAAASDGELPDTGGTPRDPDARPPDPGGRPPDDVEGREWAGSFSRRGGPGVGVGAKGRMRPLVQLTISEATALGLSDEPGYLHGYGYVPADLARRIAADADWRRLLTDPITGAVTAMDTTAHDPPASMAALVIARDRTCRFPTCSHRAETCDLDHGTAWPQGRTTPDELLCECRPHHRLKHLAGWRLTRRHGHWTWISPTGHCYRLDPVTVGVVAGAVGRGHEQRADLAHSEQRRNPDPDTITETDIHPADRE